MSPLEERFKSLEITGHWTLGGGIGNLSGQQEAREKQVPSQLCNNKINGLCHCVSMVESLFASNPFPLQVKPGQVPMEVMGMLQGKVDGHTIIVTDSFALPIPAGLDRGATHVNPGQEAMEYMAGGTPAPRSAPEGTHSYSGQEGAS